MLPIEIEPASLPVEVLSTGEARATKAGVRQAPLAPGCYIFSDATGAVLYVGKSVALRDRLSSYFLPKRDGKTRAMLRRAERVAWQVVGSEVEALILESQLVKRLQPPYNVLLREYPHYTFVRLEPGGGFPYLELRQGIGDDGVSYFGPFWGRRAAEQTIEFVNRLFALRRCTGPLPSPAEGSACFYAQVRRCSAPCLGRVSPAEYGARVAHAAELLRGDVGQLVARLERERDEAAEALRFERAAELQQTIEALQSLRRKQRHLRSAASLVNFLVVVARPRTHAFQVLAFSAARLRGQLELEHSALALDGSNEAGSAPRRLVDFILAHYPARRRLAIDLDELDQMHVVAEWLARQEPGAVYIPLPEGPLTAADAERAAASVMGAISGRLC